jgi:hypothetical protein
MSEFLYILDDAGEPVQEPDVLKWAKWFETGTRIVEHTRLLKSGYFVSTVFLGIDHSFGGRRPILFESMVFDERETTPYGGHPDRAERRYCSRAEALEGHAELCDEFSVRQPDRKETTT